MKQYKSHVRDLPKDKLHSFTLHDLPKEERPRERLVKFGEQALSAQELLQRTFLHHFLKRWQLVHQRGPQRNA